MKIFFHSLGVILCKCLYSYYPAASSGTGQSAIKLHGWVALGSYRNVFTDTDIECTSVNTQQMQQWAQPVTAGVHGVSSRKCQREAVE